MIITKTTDHKREKMKVQSAEKANKYKYLGSIVIENNVFTEEIPTPLR